MVVQPPFKPPGKKEGEGAIIKCSSTVTRNETSMETDATTATVPMRPPVPPTGLSPQSGSNEPTIVNEEGMSKWTNDILKGYLGGQASSFEQWSNSFILQFKGAMNTMSHSLRIKEDS